MSQALVYAALQQPMIRLAVQSYINSGTTQQQTWFIKGINLRLSRGPLIITGGQSAGLPAGWTTLIIRVP